MTVERELTHYDVMVVVVQEVRVGCEGQGAGRGVGGAHAGGVRQLWHNHGGRAQPAH